MLPMNSVQLALLMKVQQMQQMQQIQHIIQSAMPPNPQQPLQVDDDNDDDEDDEVLRSLFCANLDERVDEEILYELFLQAGPLEFVRLPKQRSFAFITYSHASSPIYAMNLFQGITLYGKPLVIKYQGKTAAPPLGRRLLPPDWGFADNNMQQGPIQRTFDNSALRGAYYNPFAEDIERNSRRPKSPVRYSSQHSHDDSPNGRRNNNSRLERLGRDRLHNSCSPYERRRDSSRDRDRGRDRDYDRHYADRRGNSHRHMEKRSSHHI